MSAKLADRDHVSTLRSVTPVSFPLAKVVPIAIVARQTLDVRVVEALRDPSGGFGDRGDEGGITAYLEKYPDKFHCRQISLFGRRLVVNGGSSLSLQFLREGTLRAGRSDVGEAEGIHPASQSRTRCEDGVSSIRVSSESSSPLL
jgi:hypothetical protein